MTAGSAVDRYSSRTTLALAGLILVASIVPVPAAAGAGAGTGLGVAPVFHLVGYAALTATVTRTTDRTTAALLAAAAVATAYGAGIELLQSLVPWRSFAVVDVVLNAAGAGLAALALWIREYVEPFRSIG